MVLPWLALALPGAAVAVGVVAVGAVFIAKTKERKRTRRNRTRTFGSKYHFEGVLGRGAFGRVYRITSRQDGRKYALKILDLVSARTSLSHIETEIDLMRSLDHPNIIRFYNAYHCGSIVALQMDYCPGGDLRRFIKKTKGNRLRYERIHMWMLQLSSAVEYIHSKNVMHRDLKPENVLIGPRPSCPLLLADFGIARVLTSDYVTSVHGTKSFMAPEAFQGRYHKSADVYSLGCVFICLVSVQTVPKKTSSLWRAIPHYYGETIFRIIDSCTMLDHHLRPNAKDICQMLRSDAPQAS